MHHHRWENVMATSSETIINAILLVITCMYEQCWHKLWYWANGIPWRMINSASFVEIVRSHKTNKMGVNSQNFVHLILLTLIQVLHKTEYEGGDLYITTFIHLESQLKKPSLSKLWRMSTTNFVYIINTIAKKKSAPNTPKRFMLLVCIFGRIVCLEIRQYVSS